MVNLELWLTAHRHSCHKTTPVDVVDFRQATELTCPQGCGAHWCKQCNRTFERGGIHSCDGQAELDQLLGQNNWKRCPGVYFFFPSTSPTSYTLYSLFSARREEFVTISSF